MSQEKEQIEFRTLEDFLAFYVDWCQGEDELGELKVGALCISQLHLEGWPLSHQNCWQPGWRSGCSSVLWATGKHEQEPNQHNPDQAGHRPPATRKHLNRGPH